jgi:predicted dehydrogenase
MRGQVNAMLGVGIIGAGGVGARRAAVAASHPQTRVLAVHDVLPARAQLVARQCGGSAVSSWEAVVARRDVDIVVVATSHDALAPMSVAALAAGRHVLCEKPMGRNPVETRCVVDAALAAGRCLKAGYNHRYHPAVQKVHQVCSSGQIGPLLYLRARYGHGGRPGYDREWRAVRERAGGGELLDQGAHLIDLSQWLLGPFCEVMGHVGTHYWDMPLEDNAFVLLRTAAGQVASLHVSWTQWKNLFSLEVFGRDGYALAEGLGRSYGPERAVVGHRPSGGGVPEEEGFSYSEEDRSWHLEWDDFVQAVIGRTAPMAGGSEALATMEWIYRVYAASAGRCAVTASERPW